MKKIKLSKEDREISESIKRLNGYYENSTFDYDSLTEDQKADLFDNMLTDGPEQTVQYGIQHL